MRGGDGNVFEKRNGKSVNAPAEQPIKGNNLKCVFGEPVLVNGTEIRCVTSCDVKLENGVAMATLCFLVRDGDVSF
nr:MAG TPA: ATP-binding sugar transporter [Caudoviricetes sp.]